MAKQPHVERCDGCRFWHKREHQDNGTCRRRAPVVISNGYNTWQVEQQPFTGAAYWCGEFERGQPPTNVDVKDPRQTHIPGL